MREILSHGSSNHKFNNLITSDILCELLVSKNRKRSYKELNHFDVGDRAMDVRQLEISKDWLDLNCYKRNTDLKLAHALFSQVKFMSSQP